MRPKKWLRQEAHRPEEGEQKNAAHCLVSEMFFIVRNVTRVGEGIIEDVWSRGMKVRTDVYLSAGDRLMLVLPAYSVYVVVIHASGRDSGGFYEATVVIDVRSQERQPQYIM